MLICCGGGAVLGADDSGWGGGADLDLRPRNCKAFDGAAAAAAAALDGILENMFCAKGDEYSFTVSVADVTRHQPQANTSHVKSTCHT